LLGVLILARGFGPVSWNAAIDGLRGAGLHL